MSTKTRVPQFTIPAWLTGHVAEVEAWPAVEGEHAECWVAACERSPFKNGLCKVHYLRARERWLVVHPARRRKSAPAQPEPGRPSRRETNSNNDQEVN